MAPEPRQPLRVAGLPRGAFRMIADIMVARQRVHGARQARQARGGEGHVRLAVGAVERDIAGGDDQVGRLGGEVLHHRVEIGTEQRGPRAKMRVGNLGECEQGGAFHQVRWRAA